MKKQHVVRLITLSALVLGITAVNARAQSLPPMPSALEVPEGQEMFLAGYAEGTQNYICLQNKGGYAWQFLGPQATLFHVLDGGVLEQVATHFLSVNAIENAARPTWQHSTDSSRVWGRVVASSIDTNFVAPGAIAWLLLQAAGTAPGSAGGTLLDQTTYIQRLNTSGGVAPSTGCDTRADVGRLALVPYTTDYFFYRPR